MRLAEEVDWKGLKLRLRLFILVPLGTKCFTFALNGRV
jgi:hypothetical protein